MTKIKVFELKITRTPVETVIDKDDLITIKEAADIRGVAIPAIMRMMDAGSLPSYQLIDSISGEGRIQRFTSRKAVEEMGKSDRPKFQHNSSYIGSSPLIEDAIAVPA